MVVRLSQALIMQRVEVRGLQNWIAMYGQLWIPLIIGHNNNDIWLFSNDYITSFIPGKAGNKAEEPHATKYTIRSIHFIAFCLCTTSSRLACICISLTTGEGQPPSGTSTWAVHKIPLSTTFRKFSSSQLT